MTPYKLTRFVALLLILCLPAESVRVDRRLEEKISRTCFAQEAVIQPSAHAINPIADVWMKAFTAREMEVFVRKLQGYRNPQIATDLGIGVGTVEVYVTRIRLKIREIIGKNVNWIKLAKRLKHVSLPGKLELKSGMGTERGSRHRIQRLSKKVYGELLKVLTIRETEIVILLRKGRKNVQIARQLFLGRQTVNNYLQPVHDKIDRLLIASSSA